MEMASQSGNQDVKTMLQDAVMALQAASASGAEVTSKIAAQAGNPELKELLQHGSRHSAEWRERMSRIAGDLGAGGQAGQGNPVVDAIQQVGGKIIGKASDPTARDLGIIASGQLALHYYIAAFGTMAAYAKSLGMQDAAQTIHQCLQEARQGDERYSELAAKIAA